MKYYEGPLLIAWKDPGLDISGIIGADENATTVIHVPRTYQDECL